MKTSELTGAELDWAVAMCEGYFDDDRAWIKEGRVEVAYYTGYSPSTDWAQGGSIIERECINLTYRHPNFTGLWTAFNDEWDDDKNGVNCGDTPLIAAMRCYVASKLGGEIELPEGLK